MVISVIATLFLTSLIPPVNSYYNVQPNFHWDSTVCSSADMALQDTTTVLLLGKTGHGKTATAASIVGQRDVVMQDWHHDDHTGKVKSNLAKEKPSGMSNFNSDASYRDLDRTRADKYSDDATTNVVLFGRVLMKEKNRMVNILDSPGLFDTTYMDKVQATMAAIENIEKAIRISDGGVNAFALVLRYAARYTEEEQSLVNNLETIFGSQFFKDHVLVIFTHGDDFHFKAGGAPFSEWVRRQSGELGKLIEKCQQKCLLFENERGNTETMIRQNQELLNVLSKMNKKFTLQDYDGTKKGRAQILEQAHTAKRVTEFRSRRDKIMEDFNRAQREHGRKRDQLLTQLQYDVLKLQNEAHPDDLASWQREAHEIEKVVKRITADGRF